MTSGTHRIIDASQPSISSSPQCLALDLEIGKDNGRLHQIGAVRPDTGEALHWKGGNLSAALDRLDRMTEGAAFVLGHNIIHFDLPQLKALRPALKILTLPAVDTLWLNPLAFPRNPYHHLVKHYHDGPLAGGFRNDAQMDARLALSLFDDQKKALGSMQTANPDLMSAWHWLTTQTEEVSGINRLFVMLRGARRPDTDDALAAIERRLEGQACATQTRNILAAARNNGWPLAYALAWLSVAGGNSVMPPWVRHQFPEAAAIIARLRDTACTLPDCRWCRERHDARKALKQWFDFDDFRAKPASPDGTPLQRLIVEKAMAGQHVLGILPTGTGKSLCYQIPALSRFEKTGALTVVISPLVALMADQVTGLTEKNIQCCAAINGLLSLPERADVLDRVRLGDIGILIVSPEQLRNRSLRKVLAQRQIGAWVLDEAHCLSKWGHDFRPDYRYVARFIREEAGTAPVPPVLCLTATAKPDVVADILGHFRDKIGIELTALDGGASRDNLDFLVVPTTPATKLSDVWRHIDTELPATAPGGAIVYCATRKQTEDVAAFLREKGLAAGHFHSRLQPETKKAIQSQFIKGELRVIAATNAFGMGIDKPDVRLVIHADIPGSLENYLQEAGRAGRDRQFARCILLYTEEDVERQFGMSARSRLTRKEIGSILKALRRLDVRKQKEGQAKGEVVATTGEILAEDEEGDFTRETASDDTRVKTAISWLEEALLLQREENQVQVFPSSLRVSSTQEAQQKLEKASRLDPAYRKQLLAIVDTLMTADADDGITTDELMGISGLSASRLRKALADLETLGIASNDTALTAYVHTGIEHSSRKRLTNAVQLETGLIAELRQTAPDLCKGDTSLLHLRLACQHLKDAGHSEALPQTLLALLKGLATDGRDDDAGQGSIELKRQNGESVAITLHREWTALEKTAQLRQLAAQRLLEHLLSCLAPNQRGTDLLVETTMGKLAAAITGDLELQSMAKDPQKLTDRALLWLHEQEIIRLNKGLAVFRSAMTIHLNQDWKKQFNLSDYAPLRAHYDGQVTQIHVMAEYVQVGLRQMTDALRLAIDYFSLAQDTFLKRWLPGREKELERQTTPESWHAIVESLANKAQRDIVADPRESANVLVLAGPGSGKTRVLVHRIAYLVRCRRENPRGILALAYNRHAAVQIRQRLAALIGDDARGVVVLTLHGLAMRLLGASFADRNAEATEDAFRQLLQDAVRLLKGEVAVEGGNANTETDYLRDRLLGGFRWLLVDEYQDIDTDEYELIAAIAGRGKKDDNDKINLLAVGDDDQNIYAFKGASNTFIHRFESDYKTKPAYLLENYRSTAHVIAAANQLIDALPGRMKAGRPIQVNSARAKASPGGPWTNRDAVAQGRVQLLPAGPSAETQAMAVIAELERLAALDPQWDWSNCAVIARQWEWLQALRCYCDWRGIPTHWAKDDAIPFWRLRETRQLLHWLNQRTSPTLTGADLAQWTTDHPARENPYHQTLQDALVDYADEIGSGEAMVVDFKDWLAEWARQARRRQQGLLLVSAHGAKGLEFDHVAVLDGDWNSRPGEDDTATTRLYYVAMTRARSTLCLARLDATRTHPMDALQDGPHLLRRRSVQLPPPPDVLKQRSVQPALEEVNLGYAGRHDPQAPIHEAIARLSPGAPLQLVFAESIWQLHADDGIAVGRMSKRFQPPSGMSCLRAQVRCILAFDKATADPKYGEPRCDTWEVVVPEFIFAPL